MILFNLHRKLSTTLNELNYGQQYFHEYSPLPFDTVGIYSSEVGRVSMLQCVFTTVLNENVGF